MMSLEEYLQKRLDVMTGKAKPTKQFPKLTPEQIREEWRKSGLLDRKGRVRRLPIAGIH